MRIEQFTFSEVHMCRSSARVYISLLLISSEMSDYSGKWFICSSSVYIEEQVLAVPVAWTVWLNVMKSTLLSWVMLCCCDLFLFHCTDVVVHTVCWCVHFVKGVQFPLLQSIVAQLHSSSLSVYFAFYSWCRYLPFEVTAAVLVQDVDVLLLFFLTWFVNVIWLSVCEIILFINLCSKWWWIICCVYWLILHWQQYWLCHVSCMFATEFWHCQNYLLAQLLANVFRL